MPTPSSPRWLVVLMMVAAGLAGCRVVEADPTASPPPIEQPSAPTIPPPVIAASGGTEAAEAMQRRCIDAVVIFEERIDREGFEFPEELDELSDEELEQLMTPGFDVDDGVAAPGDRPTIEPMPAFDPRTAPMLALDQMVGACFELGIVTDADVYGAEEADPEEASARD